MCIASNFKHTVALRKESVDRNFDAVQVIVIVMESLSARRAWIEIACQIVQQRHKQLSLSARRAWIEIPQLGQYYLVPFSRSPQGERG